MNKQPKTFLHLQAAQWSKIALLATGIILLCLFGLRLGSARSDTGMYRAPSGVYEYGIARRADQPAEIHIVFNLDDQVAVERYRETSNQRALKLLTAAQDQRLWTTITFAKPLSLNEMVLLLKEAQVEPVSYTQVGWTASGERMASGFFAGPEFDLDKLAEEAVQSSIEPPADAHLTGFMVVDGYITISKQSLGRLLTDERVYLVDTTAYEVQTLVGQEAQDANFHLPTPFWGMEWGK